jgi:hypothetical protein
MHPKIKRVTKPTRSIESVIANAAGRADKKAMDDLRARIATQNAEFDRLRSGAPGGLANLEHAHDLELT